MSSSAYPVIWALKHAPVSDAEERAILLALADHGDADGCNCFPSVTTLERVALVSKATVKRKLAALRQRGVIRYQPGPAPARWLQMPTYLRPARYELMIPYSWWSDAQREEVNRMREDRGRPPITRSDRPDLAAAPPKKSRADKGKKAPQRRPKSLPPKRDESAGQDADSSDGGVLKTPGADPVDNSGTPGLEDPPPGVFKTRGEGLQDPQPSYVTPPSHLPNAAQRLSSRSAQVADARARAQAPQAANDKQERDGQSQAGNGEIGKCSARPPVPRESAEGARGDDRGGLSRDRRAGRRTASPRARRVLAALPRPYRVGAPAWVLAEMARRVDELLATYDPAEVIRAAEEIAAARPFGERDHIEALRAVKAAVRTNRAEGQADDVERCDECGGRCTSGFPCANCGDAVVVEFSDAELHDMEMASRADALLASGLFTADDVRQATEGGTDPTS